MVKVGQRVTRMPKTIGVLDDRNAGIKLQARPMQGVVIYVHPKGRFHVVEFKNLKGDMIRETFSGV